MSIDQDTIGLIGDELHAALTARSVVEPITGRFVNFSLDDAYRVQLRFNALRMQNGARVVGKKIGVTSQAVMYMLGVYQPAFGYLLDDMIFNEGQSIPRDSLIQPKAEGEIAFVLKRDLAGPGLSAADVLAATDGVMACIEIIDSRIRDWKIKIEDTVADNASCGVFVLGDRLVSPRRVDLCTCGMFLEKNGEIVATGAGAAALGNPVNAVVWLANTLGQLGVELKAGEVILSGSLAAMVPVAVGDALRVTIGGIGSCSVRFS